MGGVGALKTMGRGFGIHFDDEEATLLRDTWRRANPWAPAYAAVLERAGVSAMRNPGVWIPAGRVQYAFDGRDWLWCQLPSGRLIAYHAPRLEMVPTPWGEERLAVTTLWGASKPKAGEPWTRRALFSSLYLENITQATAADLLREALMRVDKAGLKIVLHVHDEIVVEGYHSAELGKIMLDANAWAEGLPLAGEGGEGQRYGK